MIEDCQSCTNCIACFGLHSKEYHILNQFVGKEKYEEIKKEYELLTPEKITALRQKLNELKANLPHIQSHVYASENCTGDSVYNCKNCYNAFDSKDCEDCKYFYCTPKSKETQDCAFCAPDGVEFCYNVCSLVSLKTSMVVFYVWHGGDIYYSIECHYCNNLFGCVGLRNKKYCIFNKQYSKEEYEELVPRIIDHMRKTGEWGEYFPYELSPFAYNETIAQEYFPLEKEQALALGARWCDEEEDRVEEGEEKVLKCEVTGRSFKIVPQEFEFYKKMGLPIPRRCPDQRHLDRLALHSSYKLWDRKCVKCSKDIEAIFAPNRSEVVYCRECYLGEVY